MIVTITAKLTVDGYKRSVAAEKEGKSVDLRQVSRAMTETTNETGTGIFADWGEERCLLEFHAYGDTKKFTFDPLPEFGDATALHAAYMERARVVGEWSRSHKGFHTKHTFEAR